MVFYVALEKGVFSLNSVVGKCARNNLNAASDGALYFVVLEKAQ
jgi:hypothetical protein